MGRGEKLMWHSTSRCWTIMDFVEMHIYHSIDVLVRQCQKALICLLLWNSSRVWWTFSCTNGVMSTPCNRNLGRGFWNLKLARRLFHPYLFRKGRIRKRTQVLHTVIVFLVRAENGEVGYWRCLDVLVEERIIWKRYSQYREVRQARRILNWKKKKKHR